MKVKDTSLLLRQSKFQPAVGARHAIRRPRLRLPKELLSETQKIVSVCAPSGFGKSTLLSSWNQELKLYGGKRNIRSAWLILDGEDNDPNKFVLYLITALNEHIPELSTLRDILDDNGNIMIFAEALADKARSVIQGLRTCVVLFLDDAHRITSAPSIKIVNWLIRQTSSNFKIILGSTESPQFALSEYRLKGQLIEFSQEQLAFDRDEINSFCELRYGKRLDPEVEEIILSKTEGWPAALELLGLVLGQFTDAKIVHECLENAGRQAGICDYLSEIVFAKLPQNILTNLHQIAVFEHFCADLISHACQNINPNTLLRWLTKRQLFLVPLDRHGRWFRFHHFVGEYLRHHSPLDEQSVCTSLIAGGQWFLKNGMNKEAITCAIRAKNWDVVCQWLSSAADDIVQKKGDVNDFLHWIRKIPNEQLDKYPKVRLNYVFILIFRNMTVEAEAQLARFETLLHHDAYLQMQIPQPLIASLVSAVTAQRLMFDAMCDKTSNLLSRADAWLLAPQNAKARFRGDILCTAAFACLLENEINLGYEYLRMARQSQLAEKQYYGLVWNYQIHALLLYKQGAHEEAKLRIEECLQYVQESKLNLPLPSAYNFTLLAAISYEQNFHAESILYFEKSLLGIVDMAAPVDVLILKYVTMARLQFFGGNPDAGIATLKLGQALGEKRGFARLTVTLAAEQCIWLSRFGMKIEMIFLAKKFGLDQLRYAQIDVVAKKSILIANRIMLDEQPELVLTHLNSIIDSTEKSGNIYRLVELLILQAAAHFQCHQVAHSIGVLKKALDIGHRHGYRRIFLDDITLLKPIFDASNAITSLDFPTWLSTSTNSEILVSEEQLTPKEIKILKLLESDMSNKEIASLIVISEGTLKWHLNNIYRKLGCKNRSGAVLIAKQPRWAFQLTQHPLE